MTRDQALRLKVNKDTIFIFDSGFNDVYGARVVSIELLKGSDPDSNVRIGAYSEKMGSRVYSPHEIHNSEVEAWEVYSRKLACESDKALNLKHHIDNKILKLKKEKGM